MVVPVPAGATTGNVVVTVGGVASNGADFHGDRGGASHHQPFTRCGRVGTSVTMTRDELRGDAGDEHGDVQRHGGDAGELERDEHRGAGAGGRDDGQRRRDGGRRGEQRA